MSRIFLSSLAVFPFLAGCAWRTSQADHVFGPTLYRFSRSSPENTAAVQTVHVPFLFEGGRQWGVSVGGVQRLALVPRRLGEAALLANVDEQPQGLFISPEPERWHLSWIYLRSPLREPPVFVRRRVVGLHGGGGTEERAFSLGYSSITATTPREEAVYRLDFNSRRPLDATFVVNSAADAEETNQNPPRNREQP